MKFPVYLFFLNFYFQYHINMHILKNKGVKKFMFAGPTSFIFKISSKYKNVDQ